jgi:Leucine-rich repeat (LRR) protein
MGLTEVPSELFRLENVKTLLLFSNKLCALPREIAHMTKLTELSVRRSKRLAIGV